VNRAHADSFPWLESDDYFTFPDPCTADPSGIVAAGGNLSPGMLVSAYRQGIFPWFSDDDPIIWWSPDPRFVLFSDEIHVSKSMHREMNAGRIELTADEAFPEVIRSCARVSRPGQDGTWITEDMEIAYRRMHELGYAHSIESRCDGELVGGLYGVAIGRMFFGESMFTRIPNASKVALIHLARFLSAHGFDLIDGQQQTRHLRSMGGRPLPREKFLEMVAHRVQLPGIRGKWTTAFAEYLST